MRDRTTIVITHRLDVASRADRVLVLDGSRLVEQGSPAELATARQPLCRALPGCSMPTERLAVRSRWRPGAGVRVAVIDSGVHADHPHVGGVAGGVAIDGVGHVSGDFVDRIGHGTAVTAAIREKAPAADCYAVRVFDTRLSAYRGDAAGRDRLGHFRADAHHQPESGDQQPRAWSGVRGRSLPCRGSRSRGGCRAR